MYFNSEASSQYHIVMALRHLLFNRDMIKGCRTRRDLKVQIILLL
jgi:hypothetical protein